MYSQFSISNNAVFVCIAVNVNILFLCYIPCCDGSCDKTRINMILSLKWLGLIFDT